MSHERVSSLDQLSVTTRQLWETTRFIKHTSELKAADFINMYGPKIHTAFPNIGTTPEDIQSQKIDQILEHQRFPVMICAYNEMQKNNIGRTLYALAMQQDIALQPVVIDNASTDGTGAFARELGAVVIPEEEKGVKYALRKGFQQFRDWGYQGPILHTDADTMPLNNWATLLVNHAQQTLPNGGEAFGGYLYYDADEKMYSPKNTLLTVGSQAKDINTRRKDTTPTPRGPNGIIVSNKEILKALSVLENRPPEKNYAWDQAIQETIMALEYPTNSISDSRATVVVSGRR